MQVFLQFVCIITNNSKNRHGLTLASEKKKEINKVYFLHVNLEVLKF